MLQLVNVGQKSLADYATIATRGLMEEIRRLAEPLRGKRLVHVSATAFGGGVAEINYALVPLMRDAGLEAEWRIIAGADEFFAATKTIHNALQGDPTGLTQTQQEVYRRFQTLNAEEFSDEYDYVLIHDPQPAGMIEHFPDSEAHWIWRCHIDLSQPNRDVLGFLLPWLARYDAAIFHMQEYVPRHADLPPAYIWPPAIDPLTPKNMALSPEDAAYIVDQFGIDVERPLLTQVSRFDPWKDPLGVIDAYRLVKAEMPEVQLALVVIQKSIREGFGLTVSEALWKGRPTVAGRVGGIVVQIADGETGRLVDSPEQCAEACKDILRDPEAARAQALRGKEHVRRHFLTPRLLRDWLVLFNQLAGLEPEVAHELATVTAR